MEDAGKTKMQGLYNHQLKIIKEDKRKTGLFLGTGSCKTRTALELAEGKILCITPKLQREEQNFIREAKKWRMDKDITQLSKEDFKKYCATLPQFDTVIIDEAHTVSGVTTALKWTKGVPRSKTSQIFELLILYLRQKPPKRLYTLTATPTRSPMCVYGLSKILGYNWDYYEFREIFYVRIQKGQREFFLAKNDNLSKERLGRIVRKLGYTGRLSDYFDVPEQTYKTHFVELTSAQKDRLKSIKLEFTDPLVLIGKRHQIENGVLTGDEFVSPEIINDNKIEAIQDYALEFPKIVIFARYTMQIDKIKDNLKDYKVLTLQGSTKDRASVIKDAEQSDNCILIIQSQISAGFELPSFTVMIFASLDYSLVNYTQAQGRILRANALKKNLYINLVAKGGIDEAVEKSIINKVDFSEAIYAKQYNN